MDHCSNYKQGSRRESYYFDDSDDDSDHEINTNKRAIRLSKLKRKAIDKTADVIVAEDLLSRNGEDSSLLKYHDKCSHKMDRALDKVSVTCDKVKKYKPLSLKVNRKTKAVII